MKLYSHPGSCSSAVHIALIEAGLDFELVKINLRGERKLPDGRDFTEINPKGYVPVLELENGEVLTEVVAILQYIADLNPEAERDFGPDPLQRARLVEWLAYINSELHKTVSIIYDSTMPEEAKNIAREKLGLRLAFADAHLAGREYLLGGRFTVADCYLFIVLSWMPGLKFDLSAYAGFKKYLKNIYGRDSVKAVKAAAGH